MQQVFYIHGGNSFSKHEDYLNFLKTVEIRDPKGEGSVKWTDKLRDSFGENIDLYKLSMPNKDNAKYEEWKIWFEKYFEFFDGEPILIGWSLGGMFLLKYLSENELPVRPKALFILASPAGTYEIESEPGNDCGSFAFSLDELVNITKKVGKIFLMHSEDDFVVPYEHALEIKNALPEAEFISFTDRNHFLQPEFPELIDKIKEIAK